ncbi:hypothetical protein [Planctomicrobium sp. SH527]|uniref:hypothetical protein n=1 Tax=Planctomicrobium sp. SH527 TaxID=3448123 RepID=UPI003F5AF515
MTSNQPAPSSNNDASSSPTSKRRIDSKWGTPLWLLTGFLAVGVLSVTASYAPPELKRLIIFYVVYGIACGFVLNWLVGELRPQLTRSLPWLTAFLCIAGAINMGVLSYYHFEQARHELAKERPQDVEILNALREASKDDPEAQELYAKELRQFTPRFEDYLQNRVSQLGEWPVPWPGVFWGAEVILAAVAGGITMAKLRKSELKAASQSVT